MDENCRVTRVAMEKSNHSLEFTMTRLINQLCETIYKWTNIYRFDSFSWNDNDYVLVFCSGMTDDKYMTYNVESASYSLYLFGDKRLCLRRFIVRVFVRSTSITWSSPSSNPCVFSTKISASAFFYLFCHSP